MFLSYKITSSSIRHLNRINDLDEHYTEHLDGCNRIIKERSEELVKEQAINGTRLQELWFPLDELGEFDVFISHSHRDIDDLVIPFASWLYSHLGLRCFIDSQFWQYADDLLNILDKEYAWQERSKTYNYKIRNFTTSNIHIMLSMALMKMMNKTETVIFIDSDNTVTYNKEDGQTTPSPWIYEDINFAQSLESKIPDRWLEYLRPELEKGLLYEERKFTDSRLPEFYYKIDTSNFYQLHSGLLNRLSRVLICGNDALDEMHKKNLLRFIEKRGQING